MEDLAITSRRLNEAGEIEQSLVASAEDENGTSAGGITSADLAMAPTGNGDRKDVAENGQMTGIAFKVQIGAFHKHQRELVLKRLEKKADKTMMSSYDDTAWLRFFMGQERNYVSAKNLKGILTQAGFNDAFIVAFKDGKPIVLAEAIKSSKLK